MNKSPKEKAKELFDHYHNFIQEITPKEKAKELFDQYHNFIQEIGGDLGHEIFVSILAKQFTLFAVLEILEINSVDKDFDLSYYWQEVKEEINNL
jgi:hypothetical protein